MNPVPIALSLGWRMAELYDRAELPGPPAHRENEKLPAHLPGFGEMSEHERAHALIAHVSADLASLEMVNMPTPDAIIEALNTPRHHRDDVRRAVLEFYIEIRDAMAGSDPSAALAFGLGRMLADTALLPTAGDPVVLGERFDRYRIERALGWLADLETSLPQRSSAAVRETLCEWQRRIDALPRAADGAIAADAVDTVLIRALRQQGAVWRRLLTGEQRAEQLLGRRAYVRAASGLLAAAWHIGLRYLWKWSWLIVLAAGSVGMVVWAALTYAPGGTSRAATVVVAAAGFLGASWLGVRATLGRALQQAESALWEAEVAAAIAEAAAVRPRGRRVTTSRSYRRSAP